MSEPIRIYISSTFEDLKEFRDAVCRELRKMGPDFKIVGMEDYVAQKARPLKVCLNDVETCLIYIGIFGMRYGYVPQETDNPERKSITELEYRRAHSQEYTECLLFLSAKDFRVTSEHVERDHPQKLFDLRDEIERSHVVNTFSNQHHLAMQAREAIEGAVRQRGGVEALKLLQAEVLKGPIKPWPKVKTDLDRLPVVSGTLFGRDPEIDDLDAAWRNPHTNIYAVVGPGGMGKSALISHWLARLAERDFDGAKAAFAWSFYSQELMQQEASANLFMDELYRFLGFREPIPLDSRDKGRRLAELIQQERVLLVLDSLEPLQFAEGEHAGCLKDAALLAMLRALALQSPGLCVITSRERVRELEVHVPRTARAVELAPLKREASVQLLRSLGVVGSPEEMAAAAEEYNHHPLLLQLLGSFLLDIYFGDVTRRNDLDETEESASRILNAHKRLLGAGPALDLLCILGLFNRPAPIQAIDAVTAASPIPGLTEYITGIPLARKNQAIRRLESLKLLTRKVGAELQLEAHALVRDHFGRVLRLENPAAWKEANSRLFGYYRALPAADLPETLEQMAPLFQAVAHGCRADRFQEAWDDVAWRRIRRGDEGYSVLGLGAFNEDLTALENFFVRRWDPTPSLDGSAAAWLLTETAFDLRGLGRIREAIPPLRAGRDRHKEVHDWWAACDAAGNLSEVLVLCAELDGAQEAAKESIALALKAAGFASVEEALSGSGDRDASAAQRKTLVTLATNVATLAEVRHHQGEFDDAVRLYQQAEQVFRPVDPANKYLRGARGFHYCELLHDLGRFDEVVERSLAMEKASANMPYSVGLALIARGKAKLAMQSKARAAMGNAADDIHEGVRKLRESAQQELLLRGLLTAAELALSTTDDEMAKLYLAEVLERTGQGSLLLEIDAHLWTGERHMARGESAEAEKVIRPVADKIEKLGYTRRSSWAVKLLARCRDAKIQEIALPADA